MGGRRGRKEGEEIGGRKRGRKEGERRKRGARRKGGGGWRVRRRKTCLYRDL